MDRQGGNIHSPVWNPSAANLGLVKLTCSSKQVALKNRNRAPFMISIN